jgi:hypothetical protein
MAWKDIKSIVYERDGNQFRICYIGGIIDILNIYPVYKGVKNNMLYNKLWQL